VCTGNTCRSPMAEAIVKHLAKGINVKSAGVFAADGSPATIHTIEVLREQGIPFQHSSQLLTKDLVDWATYIFTMTHSHKELVYERFPESIHKIYTLKEFSQHQPSDIVDPYGGPIEIYRQTYEELTESIQALLKEIEKN
jgi:protein-tyrosine-phosphatase